MTDKSIPSEQIRKDIILNGEQAGAVVTLVDFTGDITKNTAILEGSAGSGKTTTLKDFINKSKIQDIAVSAPTHKAKRVVQNATGRNSQTLHSLLGLKPGVELPEFDINNTIFIPNGTPKMGEYGLVIIDESSMIPKGLHDLIITTAKAYRTKVLFVGDKLQLPPVKENISPSLETADVICSLTSIMRQSNSNPANELLHAFRQDITTNSYSLRREDSGVMNDETEEGFGIYNSPDAIKRFWTNVQESFLSTAYEGDPDHAKFISWTNKVVTEANTWIRKQILKHRGIKEDIINEGDVISGYRAITRDLGNNELENVIVNSEDYLITKVSPGFSRNLAGRNVDIKNVYTGQSDLIFIVDPISYDKFMEIHKEYYDKTQDHKLYGRDRKIAWQNYYAFKNTHLISQSIDFGKGKFVPKDIDFAYAITVHKSQGSTYTNTIIHGNDIGKNPNIIERKKLLYVAASRAAKQIHILNS